jgi:hypothetical protein
LSISTPSKIAQAALAFTVEKKVLSTKSTRYKAGKISKKQKAPSRRKRLSRLLDSRFTEIT